MTDRVKHTAGFTLAELMMSIAIILILAAIAIPSIFNAQNNMRMVELNNAAQSIANAAQTQMTAMKVSGTWMAFLDDRAEGSGTYLLRDEARASNILTSLSVDSTVYDGDYVIVFDQDTASVTAVFYTDGKTGFFGQAPAATNAAQTYYADGSGSSDQTARMANDPMIGYYEGTPSGATPEVALRNPVIWVDEIGRLCVQNSNITQGASVATTLDVAISLSDEEGATTSITISGLDVKDNSYTVFSGDVLASYSNSVKETQVYDLVSRETVVNNVFVIDLNDVKRVLGDSATKEGQALAEIAQALASSTTSLHVRASISSSDPRTPSIPATAQAYIEWPEKMATLTVLVTNPALDAKDNNRKSSAEHISGTYKDPETNLITDSGDAPATGLSMKDQQAVFELQDAGIETNQILKSENIESSRQSYSGGWVKLAEAISQTSEDVNVYAQVIAGSYKSDSNSAIDVSKMVNPGNGSLLWGDGGSFSPSGETHTYQVYEIWINGERAGYLNQSEWTWEDTILGRQFSQCVDPVTSDSTEVKINLSKLYDLVPRDFDGYEVYVRTTPKADEVRQYFENNMSRIKNYFVGKDRTTGMRGINLGAPVRQPFENEFGASSTVGLFNITSSSPADTYKSESVSSDGVSFFVRDDIRIYYSATSSLAWKKTGSNSSVYTEVPSAQLWGFKKSTGYDNSLPAAYVSKSRIAGAAYSLTSTSSADFELSTQRDGLFYRVLDYRDDDGGLIDGLDLQYAPNSDKSAKISEEPKKEGFKLIWKVHKDSTVEGESFTTETEKQLVSDYDTELKYGYVKLTATYQEIPKGAGLAYLEFDSTGALSGCSGFFSDEKESKIEPYLPNTGMVDSWGYYAVVPKGSAAPVATKSSVALTGDKTEVVIDNATYDAYRLSTGTDAQKRTSQTVTYTTTNNGVTLTNTYVINLNFAAAIALEGDNPQTEVTTDASGESVGAWNVRHADQFVGALKGSNQSEGEKIVKAYIDNDYKQTCDIDMERRTSKGGIFSNDGDGSVFSGVYDGGDHEIWNVHANSPDARRVKLGSEGNAMRGSSLLFPRVAGADANEKAVLKNIHIVEDLRGNKDSLYSWDWTQYAWDDSQTNVGMLAGTVTNAEVKNCSIKGMAKDGDSLATIQVTHKAQSVYGRGLLIGKAATNCILENLTTQDIKLVSNPSKENWGNNDVLFGCIVGYAEGAVLRNCTAINTTIGTTFPNEKYNVGIMYAGGLVGSYGGSLNLYGCSVRDVYLVVPVVQKDLNPAVKKLYVGNLVGKEIALEPDSNNSYKDVYVRQGESDISVDEFNGIDPPPEIEKPIDPGTEDARKEEAESPASGSATDVLEPSVEQPPQETDIDQDNEEKDPSHQSPAVDQAGEKKEAGDGE